MVNKTAKLYYSLEEQPDELHYWNDKSFEECISAMEHLRRQFWADTIDKPLDRNEWRLVDLKNPNIVYMSSEDRR